MGFRAGRGKREAGSGKRSVSRSSSLILRLSSRFPLPASLLVALLVFAQAISAQSVLLQIRPHIGDTLRMHLSQTVEMTGTKRGQRPNASSMTTSFEVFTRAIAEQYTSGGTLMRTITDSVAMSPASAASLADLKRRAMLANPVLLRVSADGGMELVDDGDPNSELRHLFGEM
ncbi:MAG TPA: hypothetical protein VIM21_04780, partial [Gemmatimonadaceae bacterium]